jgi:hypothetical protein
MQISKLFSLLAVVLLVTVVFAGLATVTAAAETKPPEQWNKTFAGAAMMAPVRSNRPVTAGPNKSES